MLGFDKGEMKIINKLSTPVKIQDFLDCLPRNWEKQGDTCMSPRQVLQEKKAHCIEAAFFAAAVLWRNGEPPLVLDLRASLEDFDHVIALYRRHGHWGAISKTNHFGLRFRDPVYRSVRELVMSYFHEYLHDENSHKTLRSYSVPVDLRRFGEWWVTSEGGLADLAVAIDSARHFPAAPASNLRLVRQADRFTRQVNHLAEWEKSDPRT
jgi:hypothetical protein